MNDYPTTREQQRAWKAEWDTWAPEWLRKAAVNHEPIHSGVEKACGFNLNKEQTLLEITQRLMELVQVQDQCMREWHTSRK